MLLASSDDGGVVGKGHAEIKIDKPADAVWAVAGDFGGIGGWMPGIEFCVVDGDDRILKTMGIVGGVPVVNHEATITVIPEGGGSLVTWDVEVEPDEMTEMMNGIYQQSLQALKDHLGG